jgi:hypothetical protein
LKSSGEEKRQSNNVNRGRRGEALENIFLKCKI